MISMASTNWTQLLKRAAKEERQHAKLCNYCYGTVEKVHPLQIRIHQKMILEEDFLLLPQRFTKHQIEIEMENGEKRTVTYCNELKEGDKVILLQKEGGQTYLILDRV